MNAQKKDITTFLLLAAIAIFIITIDIQRFTGGTGVKRSGTVFGGDGPIQLADIMSGSYDYNGVLLSGNDISSPCELSPRQAILRFEPFDLNRADIETLSFIRGIGPKLASRIIVRREEIGGFCNINELLTVRGIGPSKLKVLKEGTVVCP